MVAVLSRGGAYAPEGAQAATDFQVSYLREIFSLIGLMDITFIHADRQSMGGQAAELATENAIRKVTSVAHSFATKLVA